MILMNQKKIAVVTQIAQEIVSQQTGEELAALCEQTGKMYTAGELAAEIAVKMILRILGIQVETRTVSPVDVLVNQAEDQYRQQYAG